MEYHPFQQPNHLIEYCRQEGIVFEGYCPLAKGQVLSNPTVLQIAEKNRRTPAQICVRWSIQVVALFMQCPKLNCLSTFCFHVYIYLTPNAMVFLPFLRMELSRYQNPLKRRGYKKTVRWVGHALHSLLYDCILAFLKTVKSKVKAKG